MKKRHVETIDRLLKCVFPSLSYAYIVPFWPTEILKCGFIIKMTIIVCKTELFLPYLVIVLLLTGMPSFANNSLLTSCKNKYALKEENVCAILLLLGCFSKGHGEVVVLIPAEVPQ